MWKAEVATKGEESKEAIVAASATRQAGIRKSASKPRARKAASKAVTKAVPKPATGDKNSPIVLNCQYPTNTSSLGHALPAPRFTVAPMPPNFAAPGSLPRPHYYFHQFLANHDRLENTGSEQDNLFVTQAPAPWVDFRASQGYGNQN